MTDDLTDLPADEGELPLDDPSYIGGPVLVDFETGEVHDLPPAAALVGAYSPPTGYEGDDEPDPPMMSFMGGVPVYHPPTYADPPPLPAPPPEEYPAPPTAPQGD